MIKKCPNCGKKINNKNELSAKFCSNCGTELITIIDRKISPGLRKEVFMRDGYRCVECGATKDESRLEVDHIIPISKGGTNDIDNLQTLCRECNQNKSNIVFPDGIEIDIEITENELNRLNNLLHQNKKKLNDVTDNDELIDIKYNIVKLQEEIPIIEEKLNKLQNEYQKRLDFLRAQEEEKNRKEKLYKKLYVELSDMELFILKNYYSLNHKSKDETLKFLCEKYDENTIYGVIEAYKKEQYNKFDKIVENKYVPLLNNKLSFYGPKTELINFLIKNYSEDEVINLIKIIKNDLYKKIYSVLDDKYVPLLNKKLYLNGSKDDLVNFLVENYSENEIFDLINNTKEELFNSTYNMLDNISFELLLEEFSSIKSKNELVNYLINNYDKNGILKLIDKLKMDLSDEISMNLNQNLVLFIREKYSLKNYSKDDLINYLIENYLKAEIFDLIKINRRELFKIIYSNLDDNSVLLLNKKLSFTGSKKDLVNILIDNYSEYETSQLIDSAKKDLFNKLDALIDDEILKVMQHSGNQSKEDFLEKLIDEYNEKEILEKIENAKIIVRKNKVDKFNLMIGENTFINLKSYLHFDGNKQDLINYLVDNYSESKVKNEINQANQSARKKLIRKLNIIIDKELAEFISYKFSIVNYTKKRVINYLINNYSENKVLPLVHQIKNSNGFKVYVKLDQKNINALSKKYSIFPKKDKVIKYLISHYSDEEILYEYNWSQTNKNL